MRSCKDWNMINRAGITKTPNIVPINIPPTAPVPIEVLPAAPTPDDNIKGNKPRMKQEAPKEVQVKRFLPERWNILAHDVIPIGARDRRNSPERSQEGINGIMVKENVFDQNRNYQKDGW